MGTAWMPLVHRPIDDEIPPPSEFEGMPTRVLFRAGVERHNSVNFETGWTLDA
jgi:hypothetical protein